MIETINIHTYRGGSRQIYKQKEGNDTVYTSIDLVTACASTKPSLLSRVSALWEKTKPILASLSVSGQESIVSSFDELVRLAEHQKEENDLKDPNQDPEKELEERRKDPDKKKNPEKDNGNECCCSCNGKSFDYFDKDTYRNRH